MKKVYVLFWFDVEDYITPQSDDALKRIAEIFDEHNAKATFKFVGEKIRVLESRRRQDVIDKVAAHDIGYHTDNHSQHPVISEYLKDKGWDEGVDEFERRERPGMSDLERIFGKRVSCYGQPGSAWAPQVYPVLKKWGIPVYLDEADQVGLNDQPFWYCGLMNILKMRSNCTRVSIRSSDNHLPTAKANFDKIYERLKSDGGAVSIFYHPCEFVTTQFWDGVNFARGKNPPRDQWIMPNLKPQDEVENGYKIFSDYLGYIKSHPQVEIITATQAAEIYRDPAARSFSQEEIIHLAYEMQKEITYQSIDGIFLSPAEIFYMVMSALDTYRRTGKLPDNVPFLSPIGPVIPSFSDTENTAVTSQNFLMECMKFEGFIRHTGRLPGHIKPDNVNVSTVDFLATASNMLLQIKHGKLPDEIKIIKGNFTLEKYVTGQGVWGWIIFPEGFDAPGLIDLARLQTWTLKPAIAKELRVERKG
jgi:hypothetical protein